TADALSDLLRLLGPMSISEIEVRVDALDVASTLEELAASHRVMSIRIAGEPKWAAIEDAGRLRDALGAQPPPGVPFTFLEPVADPLSDVVGRYARTHGPFTARTAANALGLPVGVVEAALSKLEVSSRVGRGTFRTGSEQEWVDLEVLRRLKRRSLAELRSQIEPVEQFALGRMLPRWQGAVGEPRRGRGALLEVVKRLQGVELAASVLTRDVLPARIADYEPLLDQLMLAGDVVWAGRGSLGGRDGKLALYFRDQLPLLWQPLGLEPVDGTLHQAVRFHLRDYGASFFRDLYQAADGGDPAELLDALWDLVWSGEVTNDTLAPVRALSARPARAGGRPNISSSFPPHAGGRWSLLRFPSPAPTACAAAWAELLLDRHGLVTRPAVAAEVVSGGFAGLYPVFTRMEEVGRIRRGYFVEGLGGAQFALPGAVDRLRSESDRGVVALASTDPANPYGTTLAWPRLEGTNLARSAGSYVIISGGRLTAYLERGGKRLTLLDADMDVFSELARELASIGARHRRFTLETIDSEPALASRLAPALSEWGFVPALRGLTLRR
ncbi:MAG TPA: crosslink repair DNA glycosylase YcaQ family protein, partial [Acidimicrobiia bacterium]|nr:crosslink repair DNA glycosylase YcaQ family protein [Acidimicrobiia bacterium]